jgi:hypothetical protein
VQPCDDGPEAAEVVEMADTVLPTSVVAATEHEIRALAAVVPGLAVCALSAAALELARQMDADGNSATSKSMCARELRETMGLLRGMAPEEREESPLDEIRARRAAKIEAAGKPAASGRGGSAGGSAS